MPIVHFLNVKNGDCSIIKHYSGHITVIDVCNATEVTALSEKIERLHEAGAAMEKGVNGNFNQKKHPVNPILYMRERDLASVFRFILTHPDMDHMGGIEAFFEAMAPTNFWDTDNTAEKDFGDDGNGGYSEDDWSFYKGLRDGKPQSNPKRLALYSGSHGQFYNEGETPKSSGDGLYILAPTSELLLSGNECEDFNDCSYVILYKAGNHRILFAGDSHDETWTHILDKHESSVTDVDLLIAPHHGRDSGRDWEFLDVVNPSLTLLGNADSEHLAYSAWNNRRLPFITNNQAGCVMIDAETDTMFVYVTCEAFAKASNPETFYAEYLKGHYWGAITRKKAAAR